MSTLVLSFYFQQGSFKMSDKKHWDDVYTTRDAHEVTWYQSRPEKSLNLIEGLSLNKDASIIDVGAGASTLVDHLLEMGFSDIHLLDLSSVALNKTLARIGSDKVKAKVGSVLEFKANTPFSLWHDRAVFHFLLDDKDRKHYLEVLENSLKENGYFIISAFASDGPEKCSGLPVHRYSVEELCEFFSHFKLLENVREIHISPKGMEQKFIYCLFQKN